MKSRKAVSLMISYVLLIVITIGLAVGVYAWLKIIANVSPVSDCQEGTSLILEQENCASGSLELKLKNNGRFSVSGVIIAVGDNPQSTPSVYLMPYEQGGVVEGHYYFIQPAKPGETTTAVFKNEDKNEVIISMDISVIQLQPFIIDKGQRVVCQNAVITQEISNCQIS